MISTKCHISVRHIIADHASHNCMLSSGRVLQGNWLVHIQFSVYCQHIIALKSTVSMKVQKNIMYYFSVLFFQRFFSRLPGWDGICKKSWRFWNLRDWWSFQLGTNGLDHFESSKKGRQAIRIYREAFVFQYWDLLTFLQPGQ